MMRSVLETCIEMDTVARDTYSLMADRCDDRAFGARLKAMAADEENHLRWWRQLLEAWDDGLLPDIVTEPTELYGKLQRMLGELRSISAGASASTEPETCLTIATRMELILLDPCFNEFIDLMEPAIAQRRHEEYAAHIERLVEAVEERFGPESLTAVLAGNLRRTWQDSRLLASQAMLDPLTGLYNRRTFNSHLHHWTAWAARYGRPLSVMLIDVDDFQQVNDTAGHAIGDKKLTAIADAITSSVRSADIVARFGGDEFAILSPETDARLLRELSDRVLETVRRTSSIGQDDVHVTVSIGSVVASDRAGVRPRSLEELLAAADQALYAAKEMGRDRAAEPVVLAKA